MKLSEVDDEWYELDEDQQDNQELDGEAICIQKVNVKVNALLCW